MDPGLELAHFQVGCSRDCQKFFVLMSSRNPTCDSQDPCSSTLRKDAQAFSLDLQRYAHLRIGAHMSTS